MFTGAFARPAARGSRNPFDQMNLLRRQMDLLTNAMFHRMPLHRFIPSGVFPAINLTEDAQSYHIRAELPGMKAEDLDVEVVGRNLTLSGERKIPAEGEDVRYHRREREAGRFSRVITLPGDIDAQNVKANMVNGLMTITIAKAASSKPRKITIS